MYKSLTIPTLKANAKKISTSEDEMDYSAAAGRLKRENKLKVIKILALRQNVA